jgi:hypothetical protein
VREEDFRTRPTQSVLDLLERRVAKRQGARERVRRSCDASASAQLPKRACVFPRYENEAVQEALVARYFAPAARRRAPRSRRASRTSCASRPEAVDVIVYCPAKRMQLKEARMHVRWPGAARSSRSRRSPRACRASPTSSAATATCGSSTSFADTDDPELLAKVREAATTEFREATNAYSA